MMPLHRSFILCFCLLTSSAYSQQYKYSCDLDSVTKAGFYKIYISPQLSAHLKTDITDLRIADEKNKWVPHIIKSSLPYFQQQLFTEFPIIKNEITDSGRSLVIIENKKPGGITNLSLTIKNAIANRYASLSGSDDNVHWYIINENIFLTKSFETNEDYYVQWINFPLSRYRFFKLLINNVNTDPLNILKAGYYMPFEFKSLNSRISNPVPVINQKDSNDGRSYIKLMNKEPYHVDRIIVNVSGSKYFNRNAGLYLPVNDSAENNISSIPIATFNIVSGATKTIDISRTKSGTFFLIIDNKDNPPLKADSVYTEQLQNELITYLEPGHRYRLLLDDEKAVKPDYDLEIFKDSIPANIDTLRYGRLQPEVKTTTPVTPGKRGWWIWPAIIGAITVLGFFTWKLNSDMKRSGV